MPKVLEVGVRRVPFVTAVPVLVLHKARGVAVHLTTAADCGHVFDKAMWSSSRSSSVSAGASGSPRDSDAAATLRTLTSASISRFAVTLDPSAVLSAPHLAQSNWYHSRHP
ncbi:MAG: hypothetical protein ACXV77_00850 [Acidimicrobiia bacterium]